MEGFELGKKLKKLREEKDVSLREVSKKAKVSHSYLSRIERGIHTNPSPETIKKLADYYGVTKSYLLTDSNEWYDVLPNKLKEFVKEENIEYLNIGLKAKEADLSPEAIERIIETLKEEINEQ